MKFDDFTRVALSLPEAVEGAHMGRTDFRVGNRIFASLHPDKDAGMVILKPEEQAMLVEAEPTMFAAVPGGWGESGATLVFVAEADEAALRDALIRAWRHRAPPSAIAVLEGGPDG